MRSVSRPASFFSALYQESLDPWDYERSKYEEEKRQASLAALPHARYHAAFEIGCSIGVLTEYLAQRCDTLLAVDYAPECLQVARERCHKLSHVRFALMTIPNEFPSEMFDLIVVSEVGYYWSEYDLIIARARIVEHLEPEGHLLLVHGLPLGGPLYGDEVHDAFLASSGVTLRHLVGFYTKSDDKRYRLDLLERLP